MKTHTEEEFKKLLKSLFAEKKRVKELKKRLEGSALQKSFQAKLSDIQKLATPEQLAQLERENAQMRAQLSKVKPALKKLAERCKEPISEKIQEIENKKEELLQQAYLEMREMSRKNGRLIEETSVLEHKIEELNDEVKRAQTHVAKKVKEATILRDIVEKQKLQIEESHEVLKKQQSEVERLTQSLRVQKEHEERIASVAKERAQVAEATTREWQEKFLRAQEELAEKKRQLEGYEKMQKEYTEMVATVSNLKSMLKD